MPNPASAQVRPPGRRIPADNISDNKCAHPPTHPPLSQYRQQRRPAGGADDGDPEQDEDEDEDEDEEGGARDARALSAWAGTVLLQCLMHSEGVSAELQSALGAILDPPAGPGSGPGPADFDGLGDTHAAEGLGLGGVLAALGVTARHAERLVLRHARTLFNSLNSVASASAGDGQEDLREVRRLLALLPPRSPAVAREVALLELVELLAHLNIDLPPLQVGLSLSPRPLSHPSPLSLTGTPSPPPGRQRPSGRV